MSETPTDGPLGDLRARLQEALMLELSTIPPYATASYSIRQEGQYGMVDTLQRQHVIPAHQDMEGFAPYVDLAENMGYNLGRDLHVTRNGNLITLVDE